MWEWNGKIFEARIYMMGLPVLGHQTATSRSISVCFAFNSNMESTCWYRVWGCVGRLWMTVMLFPSARVSSPGLRRAASEPEAWMLQLSNHETLDQIGAGAEGHRRGRKIHLRRPSR